MSGYKWLKFAHKVEERFIPGLCEHKWRKPVNSFVFMCSKCRVLYSALDKVVQG